MNNLEFTFSTHERVFLLEIQYVISVRDAMYGVYSPIVGQIIKQEESDSHVDR